MDDETLRSQLRAATALSRQGQVRQAEEAFEHILQQRPGSAEAALSLARLALQRGDANRADSVLSLARRAHPTLEVLAAEQAIARASVDDLPGAVAVLREQVGRAPDSPFAWLLLGQMLDDQGDAAGALRARFESISRAQAAGLWTEPSATPPHLQGAVSQALNALRRQRREVFFGVIEPLRQQCSPGALQRVDRALTGYLREWDATPPDPMQRPRFFYMPDLPCEPYMDPRLHAWAPRLQAAFPEVRAEALSMLEQPQQLEDFVQLREGDRIDHYLGGAKPAWEAFFFYRYGQRYDDNHARCPRTSAVLDSLDLCRIPGQTPEVCFSVLTPGTHILPHYGVTNTRAVMHLPLVVPENCALNLVDRGEHRWREGELVMFDDTFLHESWNRSDRPRIIVLMDCWNPHLTAIEREAVTLIAQTIGALDVALRPDVWPTE